MNMPLETPAPERGAAMTLRPSLDLGLIGNAAAAALVDRNASIVWMCAPRMDGDPVFCRLLDNRRDEGGDWSIEIEDFAHSEQRYLRNTAILETILTDNAGNRLRIVDFAPRFKDLGRTFRPHSLVRLIEPVQGTPRARILLRPRYDYGARAPEITRGTSHIRYLLGEQVLRLTTDAPIEYVEQGKPFLIERPYAFVFGNDERLAQAPQQVARRFLDRTTRYWQEWVRHLSLPLDFQEAVIRAAITLKMCVAEETGGIVAALTTSIPEHAGSARNWDYRFCWLRDAYFTVTALNRLARGRHAGTLSVLS